MFRYMVPVSPWAMKLVLGHYFLYHTSALKLEECSAPTRSQHLVLTWKHLLHPPHSAVHTHQPPTYPKIEPVLIAMPNWELLHTTRPIKSTD